MSDASRSDATSGPVSSVDGKKRIGISIAADPLPADLSEFFFGRLNYERAGGVGYNERNYGHRALRQLLNLLGDPHHLPVVHVAGTKGKGSVATMVQRVLQQAGYRTGLYTSPHIHCLTERFQVQGQPISHPVLRDAIGELRPAVERIDRMTDENPEWGRLTFFDLCTATAMVVFRQQQVEVAAIEVGMGGRLDSTNVVDPKVSVITTISFDHTAQLGNTLPKIAGEKAGIIKPGRPVVSGVIDQEARQVIADRASSNGCDLWQLKEHFQWAATEVGDQFQVTQTTANGWKLEGLQLTMPGQHQRDNAAVAVAAIQFLRQAGFTVSDQDIRQGLFQTVVPGRIQVAGRQPWVVLDAAHNPASFAALLNTLKELTAAEPVPCKRLVFAVSRDKDYRTLLEQAATYFDQVLMCRYAGNPRGVPVDELEACWDQVTARLRQEDRRSFDSPAAAFSQGLRDSDPADLLVAAGSVFLLGEL